MNLRANFGLGLRNGFWAAVLWLGLPSSLTAADTGGLNLLQIYPTTLTQADLDLYHARPWEFTNSDIFRLTGFGFQAGALRVETGPADLGIGHCVDGVVWAIVIPRVGGSLSSQVTNSPEPIASIWLRLHPSMVTNLFPPATVFSGGDRSLFTQMSVIAGVKFRSSWHTGNNAVIPPPEDMTVDLDIQGSPRRFFAVDTAAQTAEYVDYFEQRFVPAPPAITSEEAQAAFDQLWHAFDQNYAMFAIRPEVDWTALRDQYRPIALASKSTYEFAGVCADMLKPLRDLHVWLTVADADVPVFNRPRASNANPSAYASILGGLNDAGSDVAWAITTNQIGFIVIYHWTDENTPTAFDQALLQMRATRALIVDVRLNGGGSENLAQTVAGRFLDQPFVYAYSQRRTGPSHTDLSAKNPRQAGPGGQWRYDRPVLLLIGQRAMSSNESFIAMMTGAPQVTTMGDHTAGSSGNPTIVQLPLSMSVSVPRWIDYLPDGSLLDEHGVVPQVEFVAPPGALEGTRDDLLSTALDRLASIPLPDQPIQISGVVRAGQWPGYSRGTPKAVALYGNYAYVAAGAVHVIDVSQPMQPRRVGVYSGVNQATGIAVAGHYAYVADSQFGLVVLDLSDPANPKRVGALETGSWTTQVSVSGNYAYIATPNKGVTMIDITNPQQPVRVGSHGTNVTCVAPFGDYVCLGVWYSDVAQLEIVDFRNPQQPQVMGVCQIARQASGLAISGDQAYVAAADGLLVVNLSDPAHPRAVGSYNSTSLHAHAVAVVGQQAFLAYDKAGLEILDVVDPARPRRLGQVAIGHYSTAVVVSGAYAYVTDSDSGLEIISISDPATPQRIGYVQVYGIAQEVAVSGDYACLADWEGGMQVISIADPANPRGIASFDLNGHADVRCVATTGHYACMADYLTGLYVIDLAATGGPQQVGFVPIKYGLEVVASGNCAYVLVVEAPCAIHVADLSDPARPQLLLSKVVLPDGFPTKMAVVNNYLHVAVSGIGLRTFDLSVPKSPHLIAAYSTNWTLVNGIAGSGNYVYVAEQYTGLQIIDLSDRGHPQWTGSYPQSDWSARAIAVSGSTAYFLDFGRLNILNITNPSAPKLTSWFSGGSGFGVAVSRNKICVANGGLSVFQRIPSPPLFGLVSRFADGAYRLSLSAEPGQQVQLQRSRDLNQWEDWTIVNADGSAQEVPDPDASSQPAQFYRAVIK